MMQISSKKRGERLLVSKQREKLVRNRFLSVPFRKRTIGAYEPFSERKG